MKLSVLLLTIISFILYISAVTAQDIEETSEQNVIDELDISEEPELEEKPEHAENVDPKIQRER